MKNKFLVPVLFAFLLTACQQDHKFNFTSGTFPELPVNMGDINSEFDDYNSALSVIGSTSPLCFSSKRNSSGGNFDIIYKMLDVYSSRIDGKLTVAENTSSSLMDIVIENANLNNAMGTINTSADELGPYLISQGMKFTGSTNMNKRYNSYILLYATNQSGNLDIKYTENLNQESYTTPKPVKFLNSLKDDAYPSFTQDFSSVYFCSNRDGNFDIYQTDLDKSKDIITNLDDASTKTITRDAILSSAADDKCPYIANNVMVFTSNRPGGYGGFDLYYSLLVNGKWSAPVNFGPAINTTSDEYRPIIKSMPGFTNDFVIFSSNRPGGKGGFDLYYVGVKKMIAF
jgi:hypothetical protein